MARIVRPVLASSVLLAGFLASMIAVAQPAPGQAAPAQPYAQPYTQPYAPPVAPPGAGSYGYPAPYFYLLTPEEQDLLLRGEITQDRIIGGGLLGMFMGFGLGHAVQGRYSEKGYLFTLGELGSIVAITVGLLACLDSLEDGCQDSGQATAVAGLIGLGIFRVWEMVDVWTGPGDYNQRVRAARAKAYGYGTYPDYSLYLAPAGHGAGGVAGLTLRF